MLSTKRLATICCILQVSLLSIINVVERRGGTSGNDVAEGRGDYYQVRTGRRYWEPQLRRRPTSFQQQSIDPQGFESNSDLNVDGMEMVRELGAGTYPAFGAVGLMGEGQGSNPERLHRTLPSAPQLPSPSFHGQSPFSQGFPSQVAPAAAFQSQNSAQLYLQQNRILANQIQQQQQQQQSFNGAQFSQGFPQTGQTFNGAQGNPLAFQNINSIARPQTGAANNAGGAFTYLSHANPQQLLGKSTNYLTAAIKTAEIQRKYGKKVPRTQNIEESYQGGENFDLQSLYPSAQSLQAPQAPVFPSHIPVQSAPQQAWPGPHSQLPGPPRQPFPSQGLPQGIGQFQSQSPFQQNYPAQFAAYQGFGQQGGFGHRTASSIGLKEPDTKVEVGSFAGDTVMDALLQQVQSLTAVSYSRRDCPRCRAVENLLEKTYDVPINIFFLDALEKGPELLKFIGDITGTTDVPKIFICGYYIGGYEEVMRSHRKGTLENYVRKCHNGRNASKNHK